MDRICIYPKDIQRITGKSERQCRNIIASIKSQLKKEKHQVVTLQEFCDYMGIQLDHVIKFLK